MSSTPGLPAPFVEHTTTCAHDRGFQQVYRYQLLAPSRPEPGTSYPLVVYLHGAGERGTDGWRHLEWFPEFMALEQNRERFACYVLAVQCHQAGQWVDVKWEAVDSTRLSSEPSMDLQRVIAAVEELFAHAPIDRGRVYLTGLSMGGYGAWNLAMRKPEWFAALAPVCGGGDEHEVGRLAGMPIWVWHGADDDVVPVSRSREMVSALREIDGAVEYREVVGRGHEVWLDAYGPDGLLEWMFAQSLDHQIAGFVPLPATREDRGADMVMSRRVVCAEELASTARVLAGEFAAVSGGEFVAAHGAPADGDVVLRVEAGASGSYSITPGDHCTVIGGDAAGLSAGTAKLLQIVQAGGVLPRLELRDQPSCSYRCVSIDCARFPQSIDTLKQVVDLCRFYGVNLLQLHLTDDRAFTFPVENLPGLATVGRSYSSDDLRALDEYARVRGVGIVPEFDVPGHSAALVAYDPARFGLADVRQNPSLAHLTRPAVYEAITAVVREMCAVFQSSPYFHFGGDEAWLRGVDDDPECQAFAQQHGHRSAHDLFCVFLATVFEIVKDAGRTPIVWEGFRREGNSVALPKDLCVVGWDGRYFRPDHLLADGYPLINASWQPMYVVGGGRLPFHTAPRRWSTAEVYAWNPCRFEHYDPASPVFGGLDVAHSDRLLGAQMCVWEQTETSVIASLEQRLAAFSEKVWHPELADYGAFALRLSRASQCYRAIARPVTILPRPAGSAPVVPLGDRDRIRIETACAGRVRYTTDGSEPIPTSTLYTEPFGMLDQRDVVVRARLFSSGGVARGGIDSVRYVPAGRELVEYELYRASAQGPAVLPEFDRLEAYETGSLVHRAWRSGVRLPVYGAARAYRDREGRNPTIRTSHGRRCCTAPDR